MHQTAVCFVLLEEAIMERSRIDLGFLEKCDKPWLLTNTYFPSKVGGRPAWLDVESIPSNDRLKCTECGIQLAFLCQVRIENKISVTFFALKRINRI